MKKYLFSMVLALMSVAAYSQSVLGKWMTEDGRSQVEIYQNGDKLNGKIVWLAAGDGKLDDKNPDAKLRSRKLVGTVILTGFTKKGDRYEGGFNQWHLTGYGTMVYSDGSRYTGGWLNDQYEGEGTYINSEGETIKGRFHAGQLMEN